MRELSSSISSSISIFQPAIEQASNTTIENTTLEKHSFHLLREKCLICLISNLLSYVILLFLSNLPRINLPIRHVLNCKVLFPVIFYEKVPGFLLHVWMHCSDENGLEIINIKKWIIIHRLYNHANTWKKYSWLHFYSFILTCKYTNITLRQKTIFPVWMRPEWMLVLL